MPSFPKPIFSAASSSLSRSKLRRFSSIPDRRREMNAPPEQPPEPIPNRPLRGQRSQNPTLPNSYRARETPPNSDRMRRMERNPNPSPPLQDSNFLEKLKMGLEKSKREKMSPPPAPEESPESSPEPPKEANEIFKKMKETGLIPNAVAMLDGLCKDGLVQEAMKLFGSMREKGTIPEVVIYTAVVEGFCKGAKPEDAKRVFRKMQGNGIVPNSYSYNVLVQGLCRCGELEDGVEFCVEMLEGGYAPNVTSFVGLVDWACKEKGVEGGERVVGRLKERGFAVNEKGVREFLEKRASFSAMVWEAIFGKNRSKKLF